MFKSLHPSETLYPFFYKPLKPIRKCPLKLNLNCEASFNLAIASKCISCPYMSENEKKLIEETLNEKIN